MIIVLLLLAAVGNDPRVSEAQRLAAHGDDEAALAGLQSVLRDVESSEVSGSAALHQNIGTLALKTGELGLAARHLLAAERRDPRNDDVKHNLRLLRDARADRIDGSESSSLGAALPPGAVRVTAGASLGVAGLVLLLRGLLGRRLPAALAGVVVVVAAAGCGALALRLRHEAQQVYVVMNETQARAAPDEKATGFMVHPGLSGVLISPSTRTPAKTPAANNEGSWLKLRLENGVEVFLAEADVAAVP